MLTSVKKQWTCVNFMQSSWNQSDCSKGHTSHAVYHIIWYCNFIYFSFHWTHTCTHITYIHTHKQTHPTHIHACTFIHACTMCTHFHPCTHISLTQCCCCLALFWYYRARNNVQRNFNIVKLVSGRMLKCVDKLHICYHIPMIVIMLSVKHPLLAV